MFNIIKYNPVDIINHIFIHHKAYLFQNEHPIFYNKLDDNNETSEGHISDNCTEELLDDLDDINDLGYYNERHIEDYDEDSNGDSNERHIEDYDEDYIEDSNTHYQMDKNDNLQYEDSNEDYNEDSNERHIEDSNTHYQMDKNEPLISYEDEIYHKSILDILRNK